jgi:hypothetical protein
MMSCERRSPASSDSCAKDGADRLVASNVVVNRTANASDKERRRASFGRRDDWLGWSIIAHNTVAAPPNKGARDAGKEER